MSTQIPIWLTPTNLESWPTQTIQSPDLRYSLSIREGWNSQPKVTQTPMEIEQVYQGVYPSEWLIVSFMEKVDPESDIRNWVETFMHLTGFPIMSMQQVNNMPPSLIEWHYQGTCPPLTEHLRVEETHLYQGLAELSGKPPELARLYILLARSQKFAWKVTLSLMSACLPGTSEEIVAANDHVRAGTTFGKLQFL